MTSTAIPHPGWPIGSALGSRVVRVVTQASSSGRYGGPFDTATNQALLLADLGYETVLIAGAESGDSPNAPTRRRFSAVFLPARRIIRSKAATLVGVSLFAKASRLVRRADIVHVGLGREAFPLWVAWHAAVSKRTRLIVQPHGMLYPKGGVWRAFDAVLIKPLLRRADAVIVLTEVEAAKVAKFGVRIRREVVIGNPLLRGSVLNEPGEPDDVLFLARLHPRKRVETFCNAATYAAEHGLAGRYKVVGPDDGSLEVVKRATADAPDRISYEGALPGSAVAGRIARSSVFVLAAREEPWGNALVSAVASGVPTVVTRSSALAPRLERFGASIVIDDEDYETMALAVHEILVDGEKRERLRGGAIAFANAVLTDDAQRRQLGELYQGLTRGGLA